MELLADGNVVGSAAATTGTWTITSTTLSDGVHSMTTRATDAAGNVSAPSPATSLTIDTLPPVTSAPDLTAASDSGTSNSDNVTKIVSPTVFTGTADAGETVQLFEGATLLGTTTAAGGAWTINVNGLSDGQHNLVAPRPISQAT